MLGPTTHGVLNTPSKSGTSVSPSHVELLLSEASLHWPSKPNALGVLPPNA